VPDPRADKSAIRCPRSSRSRGTPSWAGPRRGWRSPRGAELTPTSPSRWAFATGSHPVSPRSRTSSAPETLARSRASWPGTSGPCPRPTGLGRAASSRSPSTARRGGAPTPTTARSAWRWSPQVFAAVRNAALNLLRGAEHERIASATRYVAAKAGEALARLGLTPAPNETTLGRRGRLSCPCLPSCVGSSNEMPWLTPRPSIRSSQARIRTPNGGPPGGRRGVPGWWRVACTAHRRPWRLTRRVDDRLIRPAMTAPAKPKADSVSRGVLPMAADHGAAPPPRLAGRSAPRRGSVQPGGGRPRTHARGLLASPTPAVRGESGPGAGVGSDGALGAGSALFGRRRPW
jgi:hypothetical protein